MTTMLNDLAVTGVDVGSGSGTHAAHGDELAKTHAYWRRLQLSRRRDDLPARQPAAARAARRKSTSSSGCSATGARAPA